MENEILENRLKRLDIYDKIQRIKTDKVRLEKDIEERQVKIDREKISIEEGKIKLDKLKSGKSESSFFSEIDQLISVCKAWCIDNDKTVVGSEPAIRSIWDEDEIEFIKRRILKKVEKL